MMPRIFVATWVLFTLTLVKIDRAHSSLLLAQSQMNPIVGAHIQKAVNLFFKETQMKLPPKMNSLLSNFAINVYFDLDSPITENFCPSPSTIATTMQEKITDWRSIEGPGVKFKTQSLLGKSEGCDEQFRVCSIHLNRQFLSVISSAEPPQKTSCGHKDLYTLAMASLIHEMAHIYDSSGRYSLITDSDRTLARWCVAGSMGLGARPNPPFCKMLENQYAVSDRTDFLNLIGWEQNLFSADDFKNKNYLRSPDAYEYADAQENFAVNLEYFLLDPEYQCRRPTFYRYFSKIFDFYPPNDCHMTYDVLLSSTFKKVSLHPEDLVQVDYLLIDVGESSASQFGHTAFAVTFKNNEQIEKYVFSYSADTEEANVWDGLTGRYRMKLEIHNYLDFVNSSRWFEDRSIKSYPIQMSQNQRTQFLLKALQNYWEYSGAYYFVGNNCANRAFDHLQSVFSHPEWQTTKNKILTPKELLEFLIDRKKIDPVNYTKIQGSEFFLQESWQQLKRLDTKTGDLKDYPKLEAYLGDFSSAKKIGILRQMLKNNPDQASKIKIIFFQLESAITLKHQLIVLNGIANQAYRDLEYAYKSKKQLSPKDPRFLLIQSRYFLSPTYFTTSGYGLPKPDEIISTAEIESRLQSRIESQKILFKEAKLTYVIEPQVKKALDSSRAVMDIISLNRKESL